MINTLPRCIESALAQTEKNFEYLILDDGSTDGSWDYLNQISRNDSRLRLYRNETNCGLTYSRNRLLAEARGKFYSILDADDTLEPIKLSRHIAIMEARSEVGIVWGKALVYQDLGLLPPEVLPRKQPEESWDITTPFEVVHSATTWRRDAVVNLGGYDPKYVLIEGPELFLRMGDHYQQFYDPALACTKFANPHNVFRKELTTERKAQLSREILLNTLRRRHHVFLDKKPIWAGSD